MLQIQDIHKQYKTGDFVQKALDGVSLTFRNNEFVAVLGSSGSGKTTLLNIVGGLDRYDSGDLIINGVSTKNYNDRDWDTYRNHFIGFVFQSYNLIPHQTVLQNVELALTISGISQAERRKRAVEALEKVGLGKQIHKKPNQMSGGQMQRVAIARSLVNNPDILLADEPTGALDTQTGIQVMELLQEVAKDRLVIMVTHNPDLAQQYATRIVHLQDGKITLDTNPVTSEEIADSMAEYLKNQHKKSRKKSSMSFRTSLGLSFRNLMTKKRRTLTTSIAGSIGIIGIALILAISDGVNDYIASIESDTLAEYPLQITSSEFDVTSLLSAMSGTGSNDVAGEDGMVGVTGVISTLFSQVNANDLTSLKAAIDSEESEIMNYASAVEYDYDFEPQIYLQSDDGIRQVNPDTSWDSMGGSFLSGLFSSYGTNSFYALPESSSLYENQYDVVAGHWPEDYSECALVLNSDGTISDYMLYTLGLRDYSELEDMIRRYASGQNVNAVTDMGQYSYDEILGITFQVVCSADGYEYDSEYGVWVDKTGNESKLNTLISDSVDLTIVGIVQPTEDAIGTALSTGINYHTSLIEYMAGLAVESDAVEAQLENPEVNIFTGEVFGTDSDTFDLQSLFSFDEDALSDLFDTSDFADFLNLDTSSLNLDGISLDWDDIDIDSLNPDDFSFSFEIDMDALEQALLSVDYDWSADDYNLQDYIDLSNIDLTAAAFDSTAIEFTEADIENLLSGVDLQLSSASAADLADSLLEGYQAYLEENPDSSASYADLTNDFSAYLESESANKIISDFLTQQLSESEILIFTDGLSDTIEDAVSDYTDSIQNTTDVSDASLNADSLTEVIVNAAVQYIYDSAEYAIDINYDDTAQLTATLVQDYVQYATQNDLTTSDSIQSSFYDYLQSDAAMQILSEQLEGMLDLSDIASQLMSAIESNTESLAADTTTNYADALSAAIEEQLLTAAAPLLEENSAADTEIYGQLSDLLEQITAQLTEEISRQMEEQMAAAVTSVSDLLMEQIEAQISDSMDDILEQLTASLSDNLESALTIDMDQLADAMEFQMDADTLTELLTSMSNTDTDYETNLSTLGYIDFDTPSEIDIYPKSFEAKDEIIAILNDYNNRMEEAGETDKVITYIDLVGTMMSSVTTIINVISYVLVAFVSISLVVSCIMISIITQISVLERTKEIGILRAIGASKRNISQVFNAETFIIGISSGLIGIGASELLMIPINAIIHAIAETDSVSAVLPWYDAGILVLVSIVITVLSGLSPAHSAAKKDPVIALRSE